MHCLLLMVEVCLRLETTGGDDMHFDEGEEEVYLERLYPYHVAISN